MNYLEFTAWLLVSLLAAALVTLCVGAVLHLFNKGNDKPWHV